MSLFGGSSAAPTFSFGTPAASTAPTTTSQAPSLFGQQPGAATAGAGGGGLFGAPKPATTTTSAPLLFGGSTASAATTTPAAGGGLFGGAATGAGAGAGTAPKPTFSFGGGGGTTVGGGGGLFGGSTTTGTTATAGGGGGLFGGTQQQQQQQQPAMGAGLFGSTTTAAGGSGLFGASTTTTTNLAAAGPSNPFAPTASTSAAANPTPGVVNGINKTTKFNDLPDPARNAVEEIDKFIRGQCQLADQLKARDLGGEVEHTQRLYEQYSAEASTVTSALQTDARLLATLRAELEQSLNDLTKTTLLIEGYKQGPQSAKYQEARLGGAAQFPHEYFARKADEIKVRVKRFRATMDQIASLLASPSHALSPTALVPTLKAQHASLVSLASAVSALDLDLKRLKDDYRAIWREKTGRSVDPFRVNGGGASGVGIERNLRGIEIR